MKTIKYLFYIFTLIQPLFIFSQNKNNDNFKKYYEDNKTINIIGFMNDSGRYGKWKWFSKSGKVIQTGQYDKDKAEGTWKEFYESGKLRNIKTYKNGKITGVIKYFFEDGKIRSQSNYVNGLQEGLSTVYFNTGKIESKITYKKGNPIGRSISFFENGNTAIEGNYNEEGKEVGVWKLYFSDKKIHQIIDYYSEDEYKKVTYNAEGNIIDEIKIKR